MKLDPDQIEAIVNGRDKRAVASLLRGVLWTLKPLYRTAISLRNTGFNTGILTSQRVSKPVVSIGNLTVGGTGKTPIVAWLAQSLIEKQMQPAIVSRGYGATAEQPNDEYLELKLRLPSVVHEQNSSRVAAAEKVISESDPTVVLLDDGFQHRKLKRDLDIVLIDCTRPFGFGHLLPRGFLREPLSSIRRAQAVVLTRVDQVPVDVVSQIASSVRRVVASHSKLLIAEVSFLPTHLLFTNHDRRSLSDHANVPFTAFCGIGNPRGFESSLRSELGPAKKVQRFPDHHHYGLNDVKTILDQAAQANAKLIVCTLKDHVKVARLWPTSAIPLAAMVVSAQFRSGEDGLMSLVEEAIVGWTATS